MASIQENINQPTKGLHLDTYSGNLDPANSYTYAMNARQESEDGQQFNLTNEPSSTKGVEFPEGFKVIGHLNMPELKWTLYWLANPSTGDSIMGTVPNDTTGCVDNLDPVPDCDCDCDDAPCKSSTPCRKFTQVLSAPCLNFSIDHRVKKARYNLTNKTTEVYWTDDYNPPMWVDLQNIPFASVGYVDCNLMRIFPDFKVPTINIVNELASGSLVTGSYQFLIAYTNGLGQELSQYYSPTNPTSIFVPVNSLETDLPTGKSIQIAIDNLDIQYRYFNLAVAKNINGVTSFEVAGTFSITSPQFNYVYTGDNKTPRLLTTEEIYFQAPYYLKAGTLETQSQLLMLGNLTTDEELNYQPIASSIRLQWETWQLPYNRFEAYNKGTNSANIRGYLRDEVYAFDIVFLLSNGRYTDRFHIPGRLANSGDLSTLSNADAAGATANPCDTPPTIPTWQVYNTGSVTGTDSGYVPGDNCYVGPYQYGQFAYWESTEKYPNEPLIWGGLANQPIRHHKFPDEAVVPRYSSDPTNNIGAEHMVYPIGVKIDPQNIRAAINASSLTQAQKDAIVGFKIVRGNRSQNKSVQARGLLFDVGTYNYNGQNYLYPNYTFNDVHPDPFLSTGMINAQGAWVSSVPPRTTSYPAIAAHQLNGFTGAGTRYTFMSPDTSFETPPLNGTLRLESIEFGKADAHIVQVENNPRYTIGTQKGVKIAAMMAVATIFSYDFGFDIATQVGSTSSVTATPKLNLKLDIAQFLPAFNVAYDLIKKLTPAEQYGYQYNAVGNYCQSIPVGNSGNKVRAIDVAGYINPGMLTLPGETLPLNNFQRESSVYIRTVGSLPFTHTVAGPQDNSRFTFGSYNNETGVWLTDGQRVQRDISSYYATIKRFVPDQYGQIYTYQTVDTGYLQYLNYNLSRFPTIFGGDTYINRFGDKRKLPFFVSNTWGQNDDTDVSYDMLGNVACPTYYLTTGPVDPSVGNIITYFDNIYNMFISLPGIIFTILTGGLALFVPVLIGIIQLVIAIVNTLGLKNIILDRHVDANYFERGVMYLWAYGLPYFFVESDVNCDYRQAGPTADENFFPQVGTDIPDFWLQEKNVSIAKDNFHLYNRMYSKQNFENYFDHLPIDYDPNKPLTTHHATRIIYSEPTNLEELQNNWLVYRPNNYHDLPLTGGALIDLEGVEQDRVLTLTEDGMSVFNAFITIATDIKGAVFGNNAMFSNPPQEYSAATLGYGGSQHCVFSKTPFGHFWIDAMRGDVFQYSPSQGLNAISRAGVRNWLKENLPFKLLQQYPDLNIDNAYNGIGLSMVWDNRYERLIITKRDYIPLDGNIRYDSVLDEFYLAEEVTSEPQWCCPYGYTLVKDPESGVLKCVKPGGIGTICNPSENSITYELGDGTAVMNAKACIGEGEDFSANITIGDNRINFNGCCPSGDLTITEFLDDDMAAIEIECANKYIFYGAVASDSVAGVLESECVDGAAGLAEEVDGIVAYVVETCCKEEEETLTTDPWICTPPDGSRRIKVDLQDPRYFCDASWTIAYSPVTQSWVSFYGFKPNWYVEQTGYFQSGTNNGDPSVMWDHLLTNKCYQTFYNVLQPFDIETITKPDAKDQTLMNVAYRNEVLRYVNSYDWKYMNNITFNEAVCHTMHGTSGNLALHVKDKNSLADGMFAVSGASSISIPVSEVSHVWRFNKFMDIVRDPNCNAPMMLYSCSNDTREVNPAAVDYNMINNMSKRKRLKSDWFKIKLRNNKETRYKFIFKFLDNKGIQTPR